MLSLLKNRGTSRVGLKAAKAARAAAEQVLIAAREKLERLQAVIRVGDDAARQAAKAARAVAEARTVWVHNGCPYSGSREIQSLEDAAGEAARAAERAARDASAVSGESVRAESLHRDAQSELRTAEGPIDNAIAAIIVEEEKQKFARLQALLAELPGAWLEVLAIQQFVDPWSHDRDGVHASDQTYAVVSPVLDHGAEVLRSLGKQIDRYSSHPMFGQVEQRKIALRARAAQLRENPNAE